MKNDYENIGEFITKFNIAENAMDQRDLIRWNGRSFRQRENLAEHTHLVVACTMELIDYVCNNIQVPLVINKYKIVKAAMLHDSVELFRGDILSNTKDSIPFLRQTIDIEEKIFMTNILGEPLSSLERDILHLADLKACYMYIERELQYPCNDYTKNMYIETKKRYEESYRDFCAHHSMPYNNMTLIPGSEYMKGYKDDAGMDIICKKKYTFLPMSTTTVDLEVKYVPKEGEMGLLCARTSAANKGLSVAMCPIDPGYTGNIFAIVHNVSNDIIEYDQGESFAQLIVVKFEQPDNLDVTIKKQGKRTDSNFGGTDK